MTSKDTIIRDEFAHLEDDWESASRYLSMFIDESQQTIDELTDALLSLEAGGGKKDIEQLFISAHRLKGSSASIGLNRVAKLAHLMEDILQILVDDGRTLEPKIADGMLACTDGLRQYVDTIKTGRPEADHFADLAQQLADARAFGEQASTETISDNAAAEPAHETPAAPAVASSPATTAETTATPVEPDKKGRPGLDADLYEKVAASIREEERETTLVGVVIFDPTFPLLGLKAQLICDKLANLGNVRFSDPMPADIDSIEELGSLCFGVVTDRPIEAIRQLLHVAGVQEILIEPLRVVASPTKTETPSPAVSAEAEVKSVPQTGGPAIKSDESVAKPVAKPVAKAVAKPAETGSKPTEVAAKPAETLRVDIERLDNLMNLAGQLAIGKARVAQIGDKLRQTVVGGKSVRLLNRIGAELKKIADGTMHAGMATTMHADMEEIGGAIRRIQNHLETVQNEVILFDQARSSVNDLFESIHLLDGVSDGIRQSVMDMRMLPIGPMFNRFHRVIRDITRNNAKDIRLVITGEKTELDKRMIDELGDPMIHLIRNAADHGVESPEVREAAGKPRQGTISLDACHRGSNIIIRVSDDGKGLDADRIRAKAIEKGLVQPAEAEAMTRQQIFQFIWHPGLSTAERVTDVSGRGVGMDIVRSKITELSGTIDVDSEPGHGATFTIKLPLTLAILPSLMVQIDNDVFAVPLESVVEIVHVNRKDMATVQGHWTVPIRDRVVALLELGSIFRWNHSNRKKNAEGLESTTLVIIGEGNRQLGLAVQCVLGEEDVVIKSIADNYRNVAGIAGATILGDGRISLILDPTALIEMSCHPVADKATS
jgi:two-component system chemotaxis sensor kinase CheA